MDSVQDASNNIKNMLNDGSDEWLCSVDPPTNCSAVSNSDILSENLSQKIHEVMLLNFGIPCLRGKQREVIKAVVEKKDVFVVWPTGAGKSLCFQLPALLTENLTIVFSPLKSLILDQVHKLKSLGIGANHFESFERSELCKINNWTSNTKLMFITPERYSAWSDIQRLFKNLYNRKSIYRFVVDEAHIVIQWGSTFRPAYLLLKNLRENYPKVPIIALTATATPNLIEQTVSPLGMTDTNFFISSVENNNLTLEIVEKKEKKVVLKDIVSTANRFKGQRGIVFVLACREAESLCKDVGAHGIKSSYFHGKLTDPEKKRTLEAWMTNNIDVMFATCAFGMGVDKSDVRFVIHHSLPRSIEQYCQEIGRAGRDGQLALCKLYWRHQDYVRQRKLIAKRDSFRNDPTSEASMDRLSQLRKMVKFCNNVEDCRKLLLNDYFGVSNNKVCTNGFKCDNCIGREDIQAVDAALYANSVVSTIKYVQELGGKLTTTQLIGLLVGKPSATLKKRLQGNCAQHFIIAISPHEMSKFVHLYIDEHVISEQVEYFGSYTQIYINVGSGTIYGKQFVSTINAGVFTATQGAVDLSSDEISSDEELRLVDTDFETVNKNKRKSPMKQQPQYKKRK